MAVKKDLSTKMPLPVDPAVEASMPAMENDPVYGGLVGRAAKLRNMTPAQRRKAERDARRSKVTVDWPPELIREIMEIADRPGDRVPFSQLTALLVVHGLKALRAGEFVLSEHKRPSRVPRFEWFLSLEAGNEGE